MNIISFVSDSPWSPAEHHTPSLRMIWIYFALSHILKGLFRPIASRHSSLPSTIHQDTLTCFYFLTHWCPTMIEKPYHEPTDLLCNISKFVLILHKIPFAVGHFSHVVAITLHHQQVRSLFTWTEYENRKIPLDIAALEIQSDIFAFSAKSTYSFLLLNDVQFLTSSNRACTSWSSHHIIRE